MESAQVILERESDLGAVLGAYQDVTSRLQVSHEQLTDQVCRLRGELEEKNRLLAQQERLAALGEMAATVAHEIRNPLGSILLYTTLLERELGDRPGSRDLARKAMAGVRTLEGTVGDILVFAGPKKLGPSQCPPVDIREVVGEVAEEVKGLCAAKKVAVRVEECPGPLRLRGDAAQIRRALLNLVRNAVEAVESGGNVLVDCRRDPSTDAVHLIVQDDGPGIEAKNLKRIFDPLFTTKAGGTGLGLAVVQRIVAAHGGTITARNREEGGAEFTLRLPGAKADSGSG